MHLRLFSSPDFWSYLRVFFCRRTKKKRKNQMSVRTEKRNRKNPSMKKPPFSIDYTELSLCKSVIVFCNWRVWFLSDCKSDLHRSKFTCNWATTSLSETWSGKIVRGYYWKRKYSVREWNTEIKTLPPPPPIYLLLDEPLHCKDSQELWAFFHRIQIQKNSFCAGIPTTYVRLFSVL